MGLGELLDASIKLYRQHWKPLMAVIAFVIVPYTFLQSYATRPPDGFVDQSTVDRALVFAVVFGAASFLFVQPFLAGAIARAAYSVYLGERIDVGVVYRVALSLLLPILWVSFLAALGVAVGFLLLVIPGIIAAIRFAFATQVVVVEGARGVGALRRSWRLAKGSFWRILGTLLLAGILASVVTSILTIPTALITSRMDPSAWPIRAVGASIAAVITTPFTALVRVLLYFDMRIRKEAFDLAVMAQEMAGRGEGG